MVLEGRTDITVDDGDRAGLLLAVSENTGTRVREAIKAKSRSESLGGGRAAATRQRLITESEETDRCPRRGPGSSPAPAHAGCGGPICAGAVGVRHRDYAEEGLTISIALVL